MSKNIQRSIRFSKHIFDYVDGYRGSGFSEKFENMVIDAMEGEQSRKERLEALDRLIEIKGAKLGSLQSDLDLFRRVVLLRLQLPTSDFRQKRMVPIPKSSIRCCGQR